jgi:diketogulonate reductase-like aldo/keto reductase
LLMKRIPDITLSNGVKMPALGFGVAALGNGQEFRKAVDSALDCGYRLFETAPFYGNESELGDVLRHCGVAREELFISTKLPNACHAYEDTIAAFHRALEGMGLDYLDMFLIHFPVPKLGLYPEAWRAMVKLYEQGLVRVIGVSNFQEKHLKVLFEKSDMKPMTNQIECNPYLSVAPLRKFCSDNGIRVMNWFPLGGPREPLVPYPTNDFKVLLEDPTLTAIGKKYGKSAAQVALRWAVQNSITPIPKSANPKRIRENTEIFDFELSQDDMDMIAQLDHERRLGPDPDEFDDMEMG